MADTGSAIQVSMRVDLHDISPCTTGDYDWVVLFNGNIVGETAKPNGWRVTPMPWIPNPPDFSAGTATVYISQGAAPADSSFYSVVILWCDGSGFNRFVSDAFPSVSPGSGVDGPDPCCDTGTCPNPCVGAGGNNGVGGGGTTGGHNTGNGGYGGGGGGGPNILPNM